MVAPVGHQLPDPPSAVAFYTPLYPPTTRFSVSRWTGAAVVAAAAAVHRTGAAAARTGAAAVVAAVAAGDSRMKLQGVETWTHRNPPNRFSPPRLNLHIPTLH